jgi:hypothetical protein
MTDTGFWVTTEGAEGGTYVPMLTVSDDLSFTLTKVRATAYAQAALAAAADAEMDAAVVKQLTEHLQLTIENAGALLAGMRATRPERTAAGITFTGGVSMFDRRPFVTVHHGKQAIGQMDPAGARRHALHVLEGWVAGEHDTAYAKALLEIGLEIEQVHQVVEGLREHREDWTVSDG